MEILRQAQDEREEEPDSGNSLSFLPSPSAPLRTGFPNHLPSQLLDGYIITYDGAKILPHIVVSGLPRLYSSRGVGGPAHEGIFSAFLGVPEVGPTDPHPRVIGTFQPGSLPGLAPVNADLHLGDGRRAAPGVTPDDMDALGQCVGVVVGVGHDGPYRDGGYQLFVRRIG